MVLHINHAQELGPDNQASIAKLHQQGITLFNQSVLLKGVNDNVETLAELSEQLIQHHIIPYYLHTLDKIRGSQHFSVSEAEIETIYQALRNKLPGYLLPRLVTEVPGEKSKTPFCIVREGIP
jgi:L-lysine 2,3-aminomutase